MPKLKIDFKDDLERITYKICSLKKRIKTNNKIVEEILKVEKLALDNSTIILPKFNVSIPPILVIKPVAIKATVKPQNKVLLHSEYFLPI